MSKERTMNRRPATSQPSATLAPSGAPSPAPRIAFIQSCWHKDLVDQCREAFLAESASLGHEQERVDVFEVPGAFEIPLQAKLLGRGGRYGAIVAAALVVDGGIYRHEFVAQAVIAGLMQVQLEIEVPVISAVLTPQSFHEHEAHARFFREHLRQKGTEAARACVRTMASIGRLQLA
jgi:6,7-dimethyl-8-ribityllumazine synthase